MKTIKVVLIGLLFACGGCGFYRTNEGWAIIGPFGGYVHCVDYTDCRVIPD